MPLPPNITPSEVSKFKTTYVRQVRGKVIAVLRYWLTKHWNDDFRDDLKLQGRTKKFINDMSDDEESKAMSTFLAVVFEKEKKKNQVDSLLDEQQREREQKETNNQKKVLKFFEDPKTMDILDFKPEVCYILMISILFPFEVKSVCFSGSD